MGKNLGFPLEDDLQMLGLFRPASSAKWTAKLGFTLAERHAEPSGSGEVSL